MLEHNDTAQPRSREETPCQFISGNRRKVNVEYADIRMPFAEHALATLGVGGFQYVDLGIVARTAARHPEATMRLIASTIRTRIGTGPEYPRHSRCCTASGETPAQSWRGDICRR